MFKLHSFVRIKRGILMFLFIRYRFTLLLNKFFISILHEEEEEEDKAKKRMSLFLIESNQSPIYDRFIFTTCTMTKLRSTITWFFTLTFSSSSRSLEISTWRVLWACKSYKSIHSQTRSSMDRYKTAIISTVCRSAIILVKLVSE